MPVSTSSDSPEFAIVHAAFNSTQSPRNPLFPAYALATGSFNGSFNGFHSQSKFLAAMFRAFILFVLFVSPILAGSAEILAPLLDPAKIATLKGERPINSRLYKVLYWLEMASKEGAEVPTVIDEAQSFAGYADTPRAQADNAAILANWEQLSEWGCYGAEGMEKLRRGGSPTIKNGFLAGEVVALDHVLPVALVPELRSAYFNLQAITAKENQRKEDSVGEREKTFDGRLSQEGLLSADGLDKILAHE